MRKILRLIPTTLLPFSVVACVCCAPPPTAGVLPTIIVETPTAAATAATAASLVPDSAVIPATMAPTIGAVAPSSAFTVSVIVDMLSEPVTREQAQAEIQEASRLLRQLTPFEVLMTDFVQDGGGGSSADIAGRYIGLAPTPPNGIVLFSFGDGGRAKTEGGYSFALPGPTGLKNTFPSANLGDNQVYIAVVHFSHHYAPCGYGGADSVQATTALAGECRDQPGTACVQQNGYSMCANAIGNLYMSTPTYYVASIIVHELLLPFAPDGDRDHYNTPDCNTRMGYPPGFFDLQESQYYNDLCPYVYESLVRSHQP